MASTAAGAEDVPRGGIGTFGDELRRGLEAAAAAWDRLLGKLIGGAGSIDRAGGVAGTALAMASTALVLLVVRSLLVVPGGWDIEDYLGWVDAPSDAPGAAMLTLWRQGGVAWLAGLYLALDTFVFIPLYAGLLLAIGTRVAAALARDPNPEADMLPSPRRAAVTRCVLTAPTIGLVLVDLVENGFGIAHGAPDTLWPLLVVAVIAVPLFAPSFVRALRGLGPWDGVAGLVLGVGVLALTGASTAACRAPDERHLRIATALGCLAHHGKMLLLMLAVLAVVVGIGLWLFAALLRRGWGDPQRQLRAELRSALGDMLVRSRYVLIAVALLVGLLLGLDQARDIVYAVAAAPWPDPDAAARATDVSAAGAFGSLAVFALSALAAWSLSFACWMWTRSACVVAAAGRPVRTMPGWPDAAARFWARGLGYAPYLVLLVLCAGVIRDSTEARYAALALGKPAGAYAGIVASVVVFAAATVLLSLVYVRVRVAKSQDLYYNSVDWPDWARDAEFIGGPGGATPAHKYRLLGIVNPYALPYVALVGMLAARAFDLMGGPGAAPSMALAVIVFTLTLWVCFFGWLSIVEIVRAIPWVLLLIIFVGVLGVLGLSESQRVWSPMAHADMAASPLAREVMLGFTVATAVAVLAAYAAAMALVRRASPTTIVQRTGLAVLILAVLTAILLVGDRHASSRPTLPLDEVRATPATLGRSTLPDALVQWLEALCASPAAAGCAGAPPRADDGSHLDVYFVSTEGGGIRAAAWTADVLDRLARNDPTFLARTFSISGVSGGAVGAAVFRACDAAGPAQRAACVHAFAETDLVSPLLSAWLFEDALAKVVPTSWCRTPACGFLSRSAWFEASMETNVAGLRRGLWQSRTGSAGHRPYLFLNSTWVETGERAIASDLQVDTRLFPGAKDQLAIADHDLPLGTAAHNAARFPYVNAIGELTSPATKCDLRDDAALHAAESTPPANPPGKRISCGHLADGGYFDNSGGQSSIDALNGLTRCLTVSDASPDKELYDACLKMPAAHRAWMRRHVRPVLVFIRNGTRPVEEEARDCARPEQPAASQVLQRRADTCVSLNDSYRPERPECRRSANFYVDALGPPIALFNGSGTGAHGQLSEATQRRAVIASRLALAAAASGDGSTPAATAARAPTATPPVITLDQTPDGVRYPLGWHLSHAAIAGLERQSVRCAVP